jgi:hypothetical protein
VRCFTGETVLRRKMFASDIYESQQNMEFICRGVPEGVRAGVAHKDVKRKLMALFPAWDEQL